TGLFFFRRYFVELFFGSASIDFVFSRVVRSRSSDFDLLYRPLFFSRLPSTRTNQTNKKQMAGRRRQVLPKAVVHMNQLLAERKTTVNPVVKPKMNWTRTPKIDMGERHILHQKSSD